MTIIAYRNRVMAADGRETYIEDHESTYVITDSSVKIWRLPDGSLLGGSRASEDIERLRSALVNKRPLPKLDDVYAMMVDKRQQIWVYEGTIWQRVRGKFFAVGSGAKFALAAMRSGSSARKAVEVAISMDPYSGGRITVLRL